MMRAMPYNLQGKGVVEVSGISISQISSSAPKWKSLDKFQQQETSIETGTGTVAAVTTTTTATGEEKEFELHSTKRARATSSIDSEPTSTLDTTRRSPSPPTSTSTLSSSFTGGGGGKNSAAGGGGGSSTDNTAGVADPACARQEDWASDLHNGSDNVKADGGSANSGAPPERCTGAGLTGGVGNGGGLGMEEWDSMFPNGDGALLPWIMGEADDMGLGLKHLLQTGNPVVEYEGNAGLGVVDQGSGLESLSPSQQPPPSIVGSEGHLGLIPTSGSNLGFSTTAGFVGSNGKMGSISPNCSSGDLDCKVTSNGLNPNLLGGGGGGSVPVSLQGGGVSVGGGLVFPQPVSFEGGDEKPQIFNPQLVMNPQQAQSIANPSFLMPQLGFCQLEQHGFQPQPKRHNPGVVLDPNLVQVATKNPFLDQSHELLFRKQQQQQQQQMSLQQQLPIGLAHQLLPQHIQQQHKPMMVPKQHYPIAVQQQQQLQEQAVKDQLYKAADLIQTGNFQLAQEILARLNHQLSLPAKPLLRAALYVKEALQMLLLMGNPVAAPAPPKSSLLTPFDVVHKMNAYKLFSEVSPITQFVNFTCTQAILEVLDDSDAVHILDFDLGCGAQWASLLQELPLRKRGAPSLKITAFAPLSTTHPFELGLVRDNLVQFANDIGVAFDLNVVNLDLFDPSSSSMPSLRTSEEESIAVNIPVWASSNRPSVLPSILRFIKQRSPKIVVSMDRGFDRCDVSFPQHVLHSLESCTNFLESLDGLNVASDIVSKVEKFIIQPKIENTVMGRVHAPDKMPHWKNLFTSAGFLPLQFSNFTETQADYVVKRTPGRGFHVEKRQASLVLSWQRRELVAASAWRC